MAGEEFKGIEWFMNSQECDWVEPIDDSEIDLSSGIAYGPCGGPQKLDRLLRYKM